MAESSITSPTTMHVTTMANHTTENVTEASDWPLVGDDLHPAARAVFITIATGMVISGVGGNLLLLSVLFKQFVRKRSVHHLFIGNLALADLLTLGYWFVFFVLDLVLGYHPVANNTHCRANGLVVGTMFIVSVSFLTSVTFNRYLHVCHTRLYQRLFTLRRTVVICVVIWVGGHLLALPPEFKSVAGSYQYSKEGHICSFNREGFTYPKAIVVLFSTLPMFFIGYCNWAIFRFWRAARLSLTGRYPQLGPGAASAPAAPDPKSKRNEEAKANSKRGCLTWGCFRKCRPAVGGKGVAESTGRSHAAGKVDLDVLKFQVEDPALEDDADDDNSEDDAEGVDEEEDDAEDDKEDDAEEDEDEDTQCCSPEESTVLSSGIGTTDDGSVLCSDPSTTLATESKSTGDEKSSMTTMARIRALTSRQKKQSAMHKKCMSGRKTSSRRSHTRSIAKKRLRKKRAQEVALVRTLMVVFILVFSFFIPYFLIILVGSIVKLPTEVTIMGILLLFFNNSVNWIVYGVMNPTFREGYVQCLRAVAARLFFCSRKNNCCPCRAAGNLNVSYVSSSSGVGITPSSQTGKTSKIEPHDSSEIASV